MAVERPQSDLERATSREPDQRYPDSVMLSVVWQDATGARYTRRIDIPADQFFGTGAFGAPITGDWVISAIERMRRQGPPSCPERAPDRAKRKGPIRGTLKTKPRQRRS